jgi:tetratricopeptide (TPR) repeat protein
MYRSSQALLLGLLLGLWPVVDLGLSARPGLAQGVERSVELRKVEADRLLDPDGLVPLQESRLIAVLRPWQQALQIYREIKDRKGEGNTLSKLGQAYYSLGDYTKAGDYLEKSLTIARELKASRQEGDTLIDLGKVNHSITKYSEAIALYEEGLKIAREIQDKDLERRALSELSTIHWLSLGDHQSSREYSAQDSTLEDGLQKIDEGMEAWHPGSGRAYMALGKPRRTFDYYEQRLEVARSLSDVQNAMHASGRLLDISYENIISPLQESNRNKACNTLILYGEKRLLLARTIKGRSNEVSTFLDSISKYDLVSGKDRANEVLILFDLIEKYDSVSNITFGCDLRLKAIEHGNKLLAIIHEIDEQGKENDNLQHALDWMGRLYYSLSNYAKALQYYDQALTVANKAEVQDSFRYSLLESIGDSHYHLSDHSKAIEFYDQTIQLYDQASAKKSEDEFPPSIDFLKIGDRYTAMGDHARAAKLYQRQK